MSKKSYSQTSSVLIFKLPSQTFDITLEQSCSAYLFFIGWADVEDGHHNGCPRHQVKFGVCSAVVCRPESEQKEEVTS